MRLLALSDLHFEYHPDGGSNFVQSLPPTEEVDVCILAGDIAVQDGIEPAMTLFCQRYPQVVYVHGNHEYFKGTLESTVGFTLQATRKLDNLTWLHAYKDIEGSGPVEIGGQRFVGAPLWYPNRGECWSHMPDYHVIKDLEDWVYKDNAAAVEMFGGLKPNDVVVTHHLPSFKSVSPRWVGSRLNSFFVCDQEPLIMEKQPKLWVHGHTHDSCDYRLGKTRVVCNPFGNMLYRKNYDFDFAKVIEI